MIETTKGIREGLAALAATQRTVGGAIPGWVEGEPEFVRTTFLSLVCELMELLQLFDWKQWKHATPFDTDRAAEEFADVLAFLGYVVIFLSNKGLSPSDLTLAYAKKTALNKRRLAGEVKGYGPENCRCVPVPYVDDAIDPGAAMAEVLGYTQGRLPMGRSFIP